MTPIQLQERQLEALFTMADSKDAPTELGLEAARSVVKDLSKSCPRFDPDMKTPLTDSMVYLQRPSAEDIYPCSPIDCKRADAALFRRRQTHQCFGYGDHEANRGPCDSVVVSQLSTQVLGMCAPLRFAPMPIHSQSQRLNDIKCEQARTRTRRKLRSVRNRYIHISNPNPTKFPDALVALYIDLAPLAKQTVKMINT